MVNALVQLNENTNRVLNMIKATYGLKDKSQAIEFVVNKYIEEQEEPELRPEFIKEMQRIEKQKGIQVKDFASRYRTN